MSLSVLVIGSGQRVRRAALPALLARANHFTIAGIYSRKPKRIVAEDKAGAAASQPLVVHALAGLDDATVAAADLVYVCVSKGAVPAVLAQLAESARTAGSQAPALLIDTPVLYFKHMSAARHFASFRTVWVAEDMSSLPWLDVLAGAAETLGARRRLTLDRSAFAYHGVALAKTLLGDMQLTRARRRPTGKTCPKGQPCFERRFDFADGANCLVLEPRDYARGGFRLECEHGAVSDPGDTELPVGDLELRCRFEGGRCIGFALAVDGESRFTSDLALHEIQLLGDFTPDAARGPIAHMDAMKRVGFARLLDRIAADEPLWTLDDGLDDMWIDYLSEKTRRWRRTPFTSAHAPLARRLVSASMALALKLKR